MRFVIGGNITPKRREAIDDAASELSNCRRERGRIDLPDERPTALESPLYIHNATVKNIYFYIDTFMRRRLSDA